MDNQDKVKIIEAAGRNDIGALRGLVREDARLDFFALDGLTPLINASKNGAKDAVYFLLSNGANPNYLGDGVTSPAYWAAINCHSEEFGMIVKAGGNIRLPKFAMHSFPERLIQCKDKSFSQLVLARLADEER